MDLLPILQYLVQQRAWLVAAAALAAFVFVLRVMGAAADIELRYFLALFLAGGFSAFVLLAEQLFNTPAVIATRQRRQCQSGVSPLRRDRCLSFRS